MYTPPLLFTSARLTWLFLILLKAPIINVLTPPRPFIFTQSLAVLRFTTLLWSSEFRLCPADNFQLSTQAALMLGLRCITTYQAAAAGDLQMPHS